MKNLQRPINVFKKHLLQHHNLSLSYDVNLYEQEKDIFCFGYFFFYKKKAIYGMIDVHQKNIVYEISDYERIQGKGFTAFSTNNSISEHITY